MFLIQYSQIGSNRWSCLISAQNLRFWTNTGRILTAVFSSSGSIHGFHRSKLCQNNSREIPNKHSSTAAEATGLSRITTWKAQTRQSQAQCTRLVLPSPGTLACHPDATNHVLVGSRSHWTSVRCLLGSGGYFLWLWQWLPMDSACLQWPMVSHTTKHLEHVITEPAKPWGCLGQLVSLKQSILNVFLHCHEENHFLNICCKYNLGSTYYEGFRQKTSKGKTAGMKCKSTLMYVAGWVQENVYLFP